MPPSAPKGSKHKFTGISGQGFGHAARGTELSAEMRELDLTPDTTVELIDFDEETGWPIVQWRDSYDNLRYTTIDPQIFDSHFDSEDQQ